jgi:drug/metabolite transporter (DMT)-like permease
LRWRLEFLGLALIWGFSFYFIKIGLEWLEPLQISFGRMALGAAVLVAALVVRGERLPRGAVMWGHLAVAALILNAIPFTLYGLAEERIPSALAGICNAATPLFTVLVAVLIGQERRPSRRRSAGLALGFAGVLVVLGAWSGLGGGDTSGTLMALGAAACYGIGWPYLRRYLTDSGYSSVSLSAGMLLAGTAELAVVTPLLTGAPGAVQADALVALLALGALGTGVAYVLQYDLIAAAGATIASTVTYVIPIVSTLAGIVLLSESLTWNEPLGAAIVVIGAMLTQRRGSDHPARGAPPPRERVCT